MTAYLVSIKLAICTSLVLLPIGLCLGRWLAHTRLASRPIVEALLFLPLILPPTVIGYYLLMLFSPQTVTGELVTSLLGGPLVFTFPGLVVASVIVNLPFAVQPVQLAYANLPTEVREAAWVSGLSAWKTWWHVELPMTWQGLVGSITLVFAHTLGEFGVVLLVGGNIDGVTRTVSIAIYDSVQAFDLHSAGLYSASLLLFSLLALLIVRRSQPLS